MGSVVDCPCCLKSVIVPSASAPQAEELHRILKNRQTENPTPPTENNSVPVPTWDELDGDIDDVNRSLWTDGPWLPIPAIPQELYPTTVPSSVLTDEITINALKKRHKLTITLLNILLVIAFVVGVVFGIFIHMVCVPRTYVYRNPANAISESANEVTGMLYFLNENGERQADVDAVVICLPKDRIPSPLLSCRGLLPEDDVNNDTIQRIREMGGMYSKADTNGSFTLQYREGVRYLVIMISAHQKRTGGNMKSSVQEELRRYFHNSEQFSESCLNTDEYKWLGGKHSIRHVFESAD